MATAIESMATDVLIRCKRDMERNLAIEPDPDLERSLADTITELEKRGAVTNPNKTRDRASYVLSDSNDGVITSTGLMVRNALLVCDNNAQAAIEFVKRWGGTDDDPVIGPVITELKALI